LGKVTQYFVGQKNSKGKYKILLYSEEWTLMWLKLVTEEVRARTGAQALDPSALS